MEILKLLTINTRKTKSNPTEVNMGTLQSIPRKIMKDW